MQIQPGVYIKYVFTGDDKANALNLAVAYATSEGEVQIATSGDTKFAGVLTAIQAGATTAEDGLNVTVCNDGILEVVASGAIAYGDALALDTGGKFKAIAADATQSAANIMLMVGRAQEDAANGDTFKALIFARK
jgi:hypothetical protein